MEFDTVINNRKTIRSYLKKNISNDDIHKIIEAAVIAPSAHNRQPWRFYILSDEQKDYITNCMYTWDKENPKEKTSIKGSANQIKEANKMIIVYTPIYKSKTKNMYYKKPDYLSIGAALENMSLKCVDLGLGSCWLCDTLFIEDEINSYLKIDDYEQICSIIVGYPNDMPYIRKRFPIENLILS